MAITTHLLETRRLALGEFRCAPGDPEWQRTNYIGDQPHVVFPQTPVLIDQLDRGSILTTPNHTVFYEAGQLYRRGLASDRGDQCIFVSFTPGTMKGLAGEGLPAIDAPSDRRTYLGLHVLVRRLRAGKIRQSEAERETLALLRDAVSRQPSASGARRASTRAAHRELAEAAKAVLARSLTEPLSLERLAERLRTSPFHLARVFRAETGFSVDGYRRSLRLRAALEHLPAYAEGLTTLALELGFSSHSHFSEAFRHEFGVAPSSLR